MIKKGFTGALPLLFLFVSCVGGHDGAKSNMYGDEEDEEQEADSIDDVEVSHDYASAYTRLEELVWGWERVKTPDELAHRRAEWNSEMTELRATLTEGDYGELQSVDTLLRYAERLYDEKTREYAQPASSVISVLRECSERLDKIKTKGQLEGFRSVRIGMLRDAGVMYLCIDPSSNRIDEARRLSRQLERKYDEKCAELGVNR